VNKYDAIVGGMDDPPPPSVPEPAAPAANDNPYDGIVASMDPAPAAVPVDESAARLRRSLYGALKSNPSSYTASRRLASETGLPARVVDRNRETVESRARLDEYAKLLEASRLKARFADDPDLAAAAHDDIPSFVKIDGLMQEVEGPPATVGNVASGIGTAVAGGYEKAKIGLTRIVYDLLFQPDSIGRQKVEGNLNWQSQRVDRTIAETTPEFETRAAELAYGGAVNVAQNAPGILLSLLTRSPIPGVAMAGAQTTLPAYDKYRARGATVGESAFGAAAEGTLEVALEVMPMGYIVSRFGKVGAGEFLAGMLGREIPTELATTLAQNAVDTAVANPDKTWGEFWAEQPDAAVQTVVATAMQSLLLGGAGAGAKAIADRQRERALQSAQADRTQAQAEQLLTMASESRLAKEDPDTFEEVLKSTGSEASVYIDARTFGGLFQDKVPEILAEMPEVLEQYSEAFATGGDLVIPVSRFAARLGTKPEAKQLVEHMRFAPDAMSKSEAKDFARQQEQALKAEAERVMVAHADDQAFTASAEKVKANVVGQLSATNRYRPEAVEAQATLASQFYAVQAHRLGITPEEMFARYPLTVAAERLPGLAFDQPAYHGTPHRFDRFDLSKIGTGEGAQAYGWGLYFAQQRGVAEQYRQTAGTQPGFGNFAMSDAARSELQALSKAADERGDTVAAGVFDELLVGDFPPDVIRQRADQESRPVVDLALAEADRVFQKHQGQVYRVDVPDDALERMLDWDAKVSEQPKPVVDMLLQRGILQRDEGGGYFLPSYEGRIDDPDGQDLYDVLTRNMMEFPEEFPGFDEFESGPQAASAYLASLGIPGLKYFDEQSRGKADGTRNLVIWDQALLDRISESMSYGQDAVAEIDAGYGAAVEQSRVESKRRDYGKQAGQIDWLDPAEQERLAEIATRPETTQEQVDTGLAALKALISWRDRRDGRTSILANGLPKAFVENGSARLVGQRVENHTDLAVVAQVYRDPRFETFRVVYTKGNEVVYETGVTSRLPAAAYFVKHGKTILDLFHEINVTMDVTGADGYWFLHNHPSGNPNFSIPDEMLTKVTFEQNGARFKGHVVVDHNAYGFMADASGSATLPLPPGIQTPYNVNEPTTPHPLLGRSVQGPSELAEIARTLTPVRSAITLVGLNARALVRAIATFPHESLTGKRAIATVAKFARYSGSARILAVAESPKDLDPLVVNGMVTDAVAPDGTGSRASVVNRHGSLGEGLGREMPRVLSVRESDAPDLILQHNLSIANLLHANRMGGLAVPSLAVTKVGQPLHGFGEITLLAHKELADPQGYARTRVFGGDAYSPRYPTVHYKFDKAGQAVLGKIIAKHAEFTGERYFDLDQLQKEGAKYLQEAPAVQLDVLEREGITVERAAATEYRSANEMTRYAITDAIRANSLQGKLDEYATALLKEMAPTERIYRGFTNAGNYSYKPHTLENVVAILKKDLRAGEGFNYGVGSLRATVTQQFRSVAGIRAAKDRLLSKEEFEAIKEEVDSEFWSIVRDLEPYSNRSKDFGFGDTVINVLQESAKIGLPRALKEYGFDTVPDETQREIAVFLNKLRTMPTEYFEAKVLREVDLAEFAAAVIPESAPEEVRTLLEGRGVKVATYKGNNQDDRARVIAEMAASTEGVLFQDGYAKERRGAFNPDTRTITLLKDADLSTFLHEFGHFQLEVLADMAAQPDAPEAVKTDMAVLLKWFDVRDLDEWHGMTLDQKRESHEKFARGFEAYLFRGEAPSAELRSIFGRFRAWLVQVYKKLKALNVEVTPEVRSVFDRLVATEEQIAATEATRGFRAIFQNQEDAGMTDEEWLQYQSLAAAATDAAVEELSLKSLKDMQWLSGAKAREIRKLQRQHDELRRQVRMEVRADVLNRPVYRAWSWLTARIDKAEKPVKRKPQKSVDPRVDSLYVAIAKLGGLNREEVASTWGLGKTEMQDIARAAGVGRSVLPVKGGKSIDAMLEALTDEGYFLPGSLPAALEEAFDRESRGDKQYAFDADADVRWEAMFGGAVDPDTVPAARLRTSDVRAIVGFEAAEALAARGMTREADGVDPNLVADPLGFSSGEHLIRALVEAQDPREVIEAETDRRMLERHGELVDPVSIERAAEAAIHNQARAKFVAAELKALDKAASVKVQVGQTRRGRPISASLVLRAAKDYAASAVEAMRVRDVRKPHRYALSEAKAGREAEAALRKGELAEAASAKRSQVLAGELYKQTLKAGEEVEKALRYLGKFAKPVTSIDIEYREQIEALLDKFDLAVSNKDAARSQSLAEWVAAQREQGIEPTLDAGLWESMRRRPFQDLTMSEVRGLVETVKNIEHLGRLKDQLLTAKDKREFRAAADDITASIESNATRAVPEGRLSERGVLVEPKRMGSKFLSWNRKFASLVREMDGFKDNGTFWQRIVRPANEAADLEARLNAQATTTISEFSAPILADRSLGKPHYFASMNRSWTHEEILSIALHQGTETNRERVLTGESLTEANVAELLDTLTERDWAYVRAVWEHLDSYRPLIAEKQKRITGAEPEWVEGIDVVTKFGVFKGNYYPIKYDPLRVKGRKARQQSAAEIQQQLERGLFVRAQTRRGHLEARVDSTGRPLRYDLNVITDHVAQVVHDLAWHEYLIDANRLLRSDKIANAISKHYGIEVLGQMETLMRDIAVGNNPAAMGSPVLNHLRYGVTIAGLSFNVMNSLVNVTGLSQSMERIGAKWVWRGAAHWFGDAVRLESATKAMREKSSFMRLRGQTLFRELNELRNRVSGRGNRFHAVAFLLQIKTQAIVDVPTWWGAYEKAMAQPGMTEDTAVALADQAVRDSQGSGQLHDLSGVQRDEVAKNFTVFYSYFNVTYNRLAEAVNRTDFRKPGDVARLAVDTALLAVIPSILYSLMTGLSKGDDEDEITARLLRDQLGFLLGLLPFVREAQGAAQAAAGMDSYGYTGPAATRFFVDLQRLGVQVGQIPDDGFDDDFWKALNSVGGILFHYPSVQLQRTASGIEALAAGETSNPAVLVTGASKR
jgi:hypothetical protein